MTLIFERATESDEKNILSLLKVNMKKLFRENFGGWSDETSKKQFNTISNKGYTYVVKNDDELIGYVSFYSEEEVFVLNDIQIKKEFQQKGYGEKVLEFVEGKVKKLSGNKIRLLVFKNNPALKFYEKHNYKHINYEERNNTCEMLKQF